MSDPESDYDDEYADDEGGSPLMSPQLLMRSFLTIASSSVACMILYVAVAMVLAAAFFPVVWDGLTGERDGGPIDVAIPLPMLLAWVLIHGIGCIGLGWLTAKVAPFMPYRHGLILAIFLFVGWAQQAVVGDPNKLHLNVAFAVTVPLAITYGARLFSDRQVAAHPGQWDEAA